MLVAKLEIKFIHIHPALQDIFYELLNILHPKATKIAAIILMKEFDFIVKGKFFLSTKRIFNIPL